MATVCFMSRKDEEGCEKEGSTLVNLSECREDITSHLSRFHLTREEILEEHFLILARAGFFHLDQTALNGMWVCSKHRSSLGRHWRSTKITRQYPDHKGKKQRVTEARTVGIQLAEDIQKVFGIVIPVGSRKYYLFPS